MTNSFFPVLEGLKKAWNRLVGAGWNANKVIQLSVCSVPSVIEMVPILIHQTLTFGPSLSIRLDVKSAEVLVDWVLLIFWQAENSNVYPVKKFESFPPSSSLKYKFKACFKLKQEKSTHNKTTAVHPVACLRLGYPNSRTHRTPC